VTPPGSADLAFIKGVVYTVDTTRRWADSVAIRDGSIVAVGAEEAIAPLVGRRTEVVDLSGRMLIPGFQDAHIHAPSGGLDRLRIDLSEMTSLVAYHGSIRGYADSNPDEVWILGGGYWAGLFPAAAPTRQELDGIVADRPVFINDSNNHEAWVNSLALEIAGIGADHPDPVDGRIVRGSDGTPSGQLLEGAMDLVRRHIPPTSLEFRKRGLLVAQSYLHSVGVTAWQDAIVGEYSTIEDNYDCYLELARSGELTARVVGALWYERGMGLGQLPRLRERRAGASVGRFRANTVKIMVDGGSENHTAAMFEPYLNADGTPSANTGIQFFDADELREAFCALDAEGFQLHVHVLGDKACRSALDAFENLRATNGPNDHRHHLAHLHVVHPDDIPRIGALGLVANVQPFWAAHGPTIDQHLTPFLGEPRASRQFPFASIARTGAPMAFGSDWPVTSADPLMGIHVAVNRRHPSISSVDGNEYREPFLPHERLDLPTALAAATLGSAYVNHLDHVTGSIEAGKLADLVVLDRNLFEHPLDQIADANVLMTTMAGETVFEAVGM